jgi:S1-C subfamily serine protease
MLRRLVPLLVLLAATALGACGGGESDVSSSTEVTSTTSSVADAQAPVEIGGLGVSVTESTAGEHGLVVQSVPDASNDRLRVGDVIVSLNGAPVGSAQAFAREVGDPAIGDRFRVEVVRGSHRFGLTEVASPAAYLGAEIKDGSGGVAVVSVSAGGPAERAELKPGDVITALDGTDTPTSKALLGAIATHAPGDRVSLTVVRGSDTLDLEAKLVEHP